MTYKIINGLTSAKGFREFKKYNETGDVTRDEAIKAFCYQCLGGYAGMNGERDCKTSSCPLYIYMPYNPNKKVMAAKNPKGSFKKKQT